MGSINQVTGEELLVELKSALHSLSPESETEVLIQVGNLLTSFLSRINTVIDSESTCDQVMEQLRITIVKWLLKIQDGGDDDVVSPLRIDIDSIESKKPTTLAMDVRLVDDIGIKIGLLSKSDQDLSIGEVLRFIQAERDKVEQALAKVGVGDQMQESLSKIIRFIDNVIKEYHDSGSVVQLLERLNGGLYALEKEQYDEGKRDDYPLAAYIYGASTGGTAALTAALNAGAENGIYSPYIS